MNHLYNPPPQKKLRKTLRREQTKAEAFLWSRLRNKRFNGLKFYRQYGVGRYILDFFCPSIKLVIEVDGGHHAKEANENYDKHRSLYLKSEEIKVIRFWNNQVLGNMESVLQMILEVVNGGGNV